MAIGLVTDCNPSGFTVDVQLETGSTLNNVPVMNAYGTAVGNELTWLNSYRGSTVMLIRLGGQYYVQGTLPVQFSHYYSEADVSKIEAGTKKAMPSTYGQSLLESGYGGDDPNYQKAAAKDFHSGRPSDFLPGDKVLSNDVGSSIGLFKEGLVRLFASPLAQFVLGKYQDFARLVTRRFQGYFDFGEINIFSDGSGTGLMIQGGASYGDEAKPGSPKYTVQMFMGKYNKSDSTELKKVGEFAAPVAEDARFFIRVNDPGNAEYTGLVMDKGGNITITTSKTKTETNLEHRQIEVGKDEKHYIGNDRILEVDNDEGISVAGDSSKTVSGNWVDNAARKRTITVIGEFILQSDKSITIKAPRVDIIRG